MSQACPLLFRQIDSTIAKANAFFVMSGVIVYLITMQKWVLVFLILDFLIRLSGYKTMSPLFQLSSRLQKFLNLPVRLEDAGAKRLAAFFGLFFMIGMLVADLGGWDIAVWAIAVVFISCVLLDLFFNYCIACIVYSYAKKIYPKAFA